MDNQINSRSEFIIRPGETLLEILEDKHITLNELADKTKIPTDYMRKITEGDKSISQALAERLQNALGIDAQFWINLQLNYDEQCLNKKVAK